MNDTRTQQLALLGIAAFAILALAVIAIMAIRAGSLDANGATIVGVIVGGLSASIKDIVAAVRGYSMSAQLGKVTDQLAASGPAIPATDAPIGTPDDPVSVAEVGKKK